MRALVLEPHNLGDDAALFTAFNAARHRAHIVTALRSVKQEAVGITAAERTAESECAARFLGCTYEQWPEPDVGTDWQAVERMMVLADTPDPWEVVYAPAVEDDGHAHHNAVGLLARDVFGDRVVGYMTYRLGHDRSEGVEVEPEPWMISAKLRALSCFESQIREPSTRPWFLRGQREYVA